MHPSEQAGRQVIHTLGHTVLHVPCTILRCTALCCTAMLYCCAVLFIHASVCVGGTHASVVGGRAFTWCVVCVCVCVMPQVITCSPMSWPCRRWCWQGCQTPVKWCATKGAGGAVADTGGHHHHHTACHSSPQCLTMGLPCPTPLKYALYCSLGVPPTSGSSPPPRTQQPKKRGKRGGGVQQRTAA